MDSSDGPSTLPVGGAAPTAGDDAITGRIPTVTVEQAPTTPPRPVQSADPAPPPRAATIAALRQERETLVGQLEEAQYDIGGLAMEMVRRDQFNAALIERGAADAIRCERRIAEIDETIVALRDTGGDRSVIGALPMHACERCHSPLAPDANFCAFCGTPRGSA
jgi:hypothetical protein